MMTNSISIQCPKCRAKFRLSNREAVGKEVPCPKCRQPFVVEPLPVPEFDPDSPSEQETFDEYYVARENGYRAAPEPPVPPPGGGLSSELESH